MGIPVVQAPANATDAARITDLITIGQHQACAYMFAAAPPAYTYANGTSGVGATITANSHGAWTVDGQTLTVGDRILLPSAFAAAGSDAGIYVVTTVGTGSVFTVLTRAADFNSATAGIPGSIAYGASVRVVRGTVYSATEWIMSQSSAITVGTTTITWTQLQAIPEYPAAATQAANLVLAGPSSGSAAVPTYRSLVSADLPAISGIPLLATVVTSATLPANTYSNGTSGVGATLIATTNGILTINGHNVALNDTVLVNWEATGSHNGFYVCTTAGTSGVKYVLTRSTSMNTGASVLNAIVYCSPNDNTFAGLFFLSPATTAPTIGTTAINFYQMVAGTVSTISVTGSITVTNGAALIAGQWYVCSGSSGITITLPTHVNGQTVNVVSVYNRTAITNVWDSSSNSIVQLQPGQSVTLADNGTTWEQTGSTQGGFLSTYGRQCAVNQNGIITGNVTLTFNDELAIVDCTGGNRTITLPDPNNLYYQAYATQAGFESKYQAACIEIVRIDNSGNTLTVSTGGTREFVNLSGTPTSTTIPGYGSLRLRGWANAGNAQTMWYIV